MEIPERPQSREENWLGVIIGQETAQIPEGNPQSRVEAYLKYIAENGGGGGGTTNYNMLSNRPKINGHVLEGDQSGEDLGLGGGPTIIPVAYKYYRLGISRFQRDGADVTWSSIGVLTLFGQDGEALNLTTSSGYSNLVYSASSYLNDGYRPELVADPDLNTRWRTNDNDSNQWVQVKFPSAVRVYCFSITPHKQSTNSYLDAPATFALMASNDGTNWTELMSQTDLLTGWSRGVARTFTFPGLALYNDLGLKPSINGHILTGTSQTGGALGLGTGIGVYWISGAYSSDAQLAGVNNRSVTKGNDGYAYIPVAQLQSDTGSAPSLAKYGLVGVVDGYGIVTTTYGADTIPGVLKTSTATDSQIENRDNRTSGANMYNPITPRRIDKAVRSALGNYKSALGGEWTATEQANAVALLGALAASKLTISTTAPTAAATDGGLHIVYLSEEPSAKYDGYIYLIDEEV